ncbi:hypothetical protein CA13_00290 [Planctomycetes bacterium CA13]|uniref:Uncharacterized protein n=1 Tax=Novipirellula herctigrandis TaxID=2527986 RepID=A0A5C5YVH3_9BACT|nr:hypothetical protein CA13_00290 [Planctomycetes bacterium CA13]
MTDDPMPAVRASVTETNHDGITLQSLRRATATFGLWAAGVVAILGSLISLSLLIIVPLFSLENESWNRAENPHTIANVILYSAIGATAIFAARSSDRVRFWLGVTVFVAYIAYGLYDLGLFDA